MSDSMMFHNRKQREFIPEGKKDESYWDRRRRNNEAAKRSREKRRLNDMVLEQKVVELSKENHLLKAQLTAVKDKYGIQVDDIISEQEALTTFPQVDEILSFTKKTKVSPSQNVLKLGNGDSLMSSNGSIPSTGSNCNMKSPSPQTSHHQSQQIQQQHIISHNQYPPPIQTESPRLQPIAYSTTAMNSINEDDSHMYHSIETEPKEEGFYKTCNNEENNSYSSTSEGHQYYEDSVLNLSSRKSSGEYSDSSSYSSHIDYRYQDMENIRRTPPYDSSSSLPLKLRHKTQNMGSERDAAHSLLALYNIKHEPTENVVEIDDYIRLPDDRESISRLNSCSPAGDYQPPSTPNLPSSTTITTVSVPEETAMNLDKHQGGRGGDGGGEEVIFQHVDRLASELANIKYLLGRQKMSRPDTDSDSSSR